MREEALLLAEQAADEMGYINQEREDFICEFLKGFEEGAQKEAISIARSLLSQGVDIHVIAEASDLNLEELYAIQN